MKASLSSWIQRWWPAVAQRLRRHAATLAACATVGLATAWAQPANALTVHLSVSPTETLQQAFAIFYLQNSSGGDSYPYAWGNPLGTLAGGETHEFDFDYPEFDVDMILHDMVTLDSAPRWSILALHGTPDAEGITVTSPNSDPIDNAETYESLIVPHLDSGYVTYYGLETEAGMLTHLQDLSAYAPEVQETVRKQRYEYVASDLPEVVDLPFGQQATLINFSEAAAAGTAIATVPEPASWVLLVSTVGVVGVIVLRRRASSLEQRIGTIRQ